MKDQSKTKQVLIQELASLRQRIAELEQSQSKRKGLEKALWESEEELHLTLNATTDGIYKWNFKTKVLFFSPRYYTMLGYDPGELPATYKTWVSLIHPDDLAGALRFAEDYLVSKPDCYENEFRMRTKAGGYRWIHARSTVVERDEHGDAVRLIGNHTDITERKQVEEALRESEGKWRSLVSSSPDFIALHDQEGGYLFLNHYAEGFTEKDVLGKKGYEFVSQKFREIYRTAFEECIRTMTKQSAEYSAMGDFGKARMYESTFVPIIGHGNEINVLVVAKDITSRKRAEEELRTSYQQLRALAVRLQQIREEARMMIAREIHDELGGGLTGLKMNLSWLLHKVYDTEAGKERVALMNRIHESSELIAQMIQVVRRIATDLRPSVLDDLGLIAALEWQLQEFTSRTDIPHEFVTAFDYVNLEKATAVAVFRIFQETLTNVARHAGATKVTILLQKGERSLLEGDSLCLEIRDNGKGITEGEILDVKSLGILGMKERALVFGGDFQISGEPDSGTTVVLKIPLREGKPS